MILSWVDGLMYGFQGLILRVLSRTNESINLRGASAPLAATRQRGVTGLYCDTAAVDRTSALRHSPLLCTPGESRERAVRGLAERHAIQTPYLYRSFSKQNTC